MKEKKKGTKIITGSSCKDIDRGSHNELSKKIMRGSLWSMGGQIAPLLASAIATPFVIRLLGTELYGVLSLINVLMGYLSFADIGMGLASTKFGVEAYKKNDLKKENAIIWTSLLINSFPIFLLTTLLALSAKPLVENFFNIPNSLHHTTIVALHLALLGFVARAIAGVINTPQLIRLRLDLFNIITIACNVLQIVLVPFVLLLGSGLVGAIGAISIMNLIMAIALGLTSKKLLPSLFTPNVDLSLIKPLLSYGVSIFVSILLTNVFLHTEKIILVQFASVTALAYYSVAFTLARMLIFIPLAFNQSVFPAFTRLQGMIDKKPLHLLYTKSCRGLLLSLLPVTVMICMLAQHFIPFWAGEEYRENSLICLYILAVGCFFEGMLYIPVSLLRSVGKPHLITGIQTIELLPYLWLSATLSSSSGAVGAAVAWSLRSMLECCLYFTFATKIVGCPLLETFKDKYFYLSILFLVFAFCFSVQNPNSLIGVSVGVSLVLLGYGGLVWYGVLNLEEKKYILSSIQIKFS